MTDSTNNKCVWYSNPTTTGGWGTPISTTVTTTPPIMWTYDWNQQLTAKMPQVRGKNFRNRESGEIVEKVGERRMYNDETLVEYKVVSHVNPTKFYETHTGSRYGFEVVMPLDLFNKIFVAVEETKIWVDKPERSREIAYDLNPEFSDIAKVDGHWEYVRKETIKPGVTVSEVDVSTVKIDAKIPEFEYEYVAVKALPKMLDEEIINSVQVPLYNEVNTGWVRDSGGKIVSPSQDPIEALEAFKNK